MLLRSVRLFDSWLAHLKCKRIRVFACRPREQSIQMPRIQFQRRDQVLDRSSTIPMHVFVLVFHAEQYPYVQRKENDERKAVQRKVGVGK